MSQQAFMPCVPKRLPEHLWEAAARIAHEENPANKPTPAAVGMLRSLLPVDVDLTPKHIAAITTKYWHGGGVDLSVQFLDNPPQTVRSRILQHMNRWGDTGNVRFRETNQQGQVRILRLPGDGYFSYLGVDILSIPAGQCTMNLDSFSDRTPEAEYARVVEHETGHCLSGDTLVDCPRDLEKYPLGVPIKDLVGQRPWVYAWKDGRPVIRQASRVWLSRKAVSTVRVLLRPGQGSKKTRTYLPPMELVGTPEHLVLLADGETWKPLGKLKAGDRLCSLYRQKNGDRSRICWTGGDRLREHVFVCEQVYGPRPEGHDAHHKNGRMLDQSPDNLEWKDEYTHHRDHSLGRKDSPETSVRRSAAQRNREPPTAETRAKMAASAKARPPISEETKAKISAVSKGKPQSPETVAKRTAAMNRFYANGGRSGMYGKKASAETKAKRSAAMKATLARKRATGGNHVVVSVERSGTMDVYDMTVPEADSFVANGVVVHNSLGFPHEHMRRAIVQLIDPQRAIAYFMATQGWTQRDVQQQVLTPLEEEQLIPGPIDQTSVMCYQLPGTIMKNGQPVVGGNGINAADAAFCAKLYPKAIVVTPPDPTKPAGKITVVLNLPPDVKGGSYTLTN